MFISFEGIEGCGKSTQVQRLARTLESRGIALLTTREPGGTDLGRRLRELLLAPTDRPMAPEAELLLYTADRAQHLREVIEPALAAGKLVLCDRFLDATVAYQGYGRGLGVQAILDLHRSAPLDRRPRRTVLVDLDPEIALERARRRNVETGADVSEGRFEAEELAFHRRVREGYLAIARAEPERLFVVDGNGDPATVAARTLAVVEELL